MSRKLSPLKGSRAFFGETFPMLLGRYPDRPSPSHVLNGFLRSALGAGTLADNVRVFVKSPSAGWIPECLSWEIRSSLAEMAVFRAALEGLVDPDRRLFPSLGSFFPVHGAVISSDPSDDGFGSALLDVIASAHPRMAVELNELVYPVAPTDGASALAFAVCGGEAHPIPALGTGKELPSWLKNRGGLAIEFNRSLGALVGDRVRNEGLPRTSRIAGLSKATYLATYLAALRYPELLTKRASDWTEVSPLFAYGGVPPGNQREVTVRVAARSFELVVASHRDALRKSLVDALGKVKLPKNLPSRQTASVAIRAAFPHLKKGVVDEAISEAGQTASLKEIASRLLTAIYPPGHLEGGFRSMGRKIGFAGPDRGFGSPRFLFETPTLALLVEATVEKGKGVPFESWLDLIYERFGILVGRSLKVDTVSLLSGLAPRGLIESAVNSNQEAVRRRLIRSGLAIEYSDAETEVQRFDD